MATILISELNEYLNLHPYWNKLTEIQKINVLNSTFSKFKKDKVFYAGNINKCYYPYDTYKTNIKKILENINFPEKYLPLLIHFSTYKLSLNLYQYTYEKNIFTQTNKNLLDKVLFNIKDKISSIVKTKILSTTSFYYKVVIEKFLQHLKSNINIEYNYRMYDYLTMEFNNTINFKYLLTKNILKKSLDRKINFASVFINEKLKRIISSKPYLTNKISEETINKKRIGLNPIYSEIYFTDILINKFPKNSINYLIS